MTDNKKLRRVSVYAIEINGDERQDGRSIWVKYAREDEDNDLPPLERGWIYRLIYEDVDEEDLEV